MMHGLVCLAVRRNLKFSPQALHHLEFNKKHLPSNVLPFLLYATKSHGEKDNKAQAKKPQNATDAKAEINNIIAQAKKGKINVDTLKVLGQRVITEGQIKSYSQAPQTIQKVTFVALAPFVGIPLLTIITGSTFSCLFYVQLAYGATVLAFLSGSNCCEAINQNDLSYDKLLWCISPQLIGWTSLLLPLPIGMLLASFGFCVCVVHDVLLTSYPQWMKSLRVILTGVAVGSLLLAVPLCIILSRRRSWSSRSRSGSSRSGRERSKSSSSSKRRGRSKSSASKSHSRSRSSSRDGSKNRKLSRSSSRSSESTKKEESPPKIVVPRYYGRNRKDSSSSLSLDSSDSDSKNNTEQQPSSSNAVRNNNKKTVLDDYNSSGRSAGNARPTSKQSNKERPHEKLKKKMQALLNKQFKADKKAEKERLEKAEQERQDREAELRDIAIRIRRRERYLRHRGEDDENDAEREGMRKRQRLLRRLADADARRLGKRCWKTPSPSSDSGRSRDSSSDSRRSRSPKRSSRRSKSPSPRSNRLGKRALVNY